jgi:hypothetical protein
MWKVLIFGEGVEGRELEVHPDHLFKIHTDPDDFESLKDGSWMGGDTFNCFMEIMSQSMGWGYNKMPPAHKQIAGKRQLWIANSHLLNTEDWNNPFHGMNRGVSGKLVATQFKSVHQHISGPSESTEKE